MAAEARAAELARLWGTPCAVPVSRATKAIEREPSESDDNTNSSEASEHTDEDSDTSEAPCAAPGRRPAHTGRVARKAQWDPGSCTWPDGRKCCSSRCFGKWSEDSVARLRSAASGRAVPKRDRVAFVRARRRVVRGHERDSVRGSFVLEADAVFGDKEYEPALGALCVESEKVCARFFCWATGVSTAFAASAVSLREQNAPEKMRMRLDVKAADAAAWLKAQGRTANKMPDSHLVHLPYPRKEDVSPRRSNDASTKPTPRITRRRWLRPT